MERRLGLKLFCVRSELGPVVPMTSHFTLFPPRFVSWTRRGVSSESFEIQLFQLFLGFLAKTNKKKKNKKKKKKKKSSRVCLLNLCLWCRLCFWIAFSHFLSLLHLPTSCEVRRLLRSCLSLTLLYPFALQLDPFPSPPTKAGASWEKPDGFRGGWLPPQE